MEHAVIRPLALNANVTSLIPVHCVIQVSYVQNVEIKQFVYSNFALFIRLFSDVVINAYYKICLIST